MAKALVGSAASIDRPAVLGEWRIWLLALMAFVLAGCSGAANMGSILSDEPDAQRTASTGPAPPPQPKATGRKVALLLPLSAKGTESVAAALKQAAELAVSDAGGGGITLVTKDTGGTASGARAAAEAALNDGAELVLGPLLSGEVEAVSPVARAKGVSVIAFSSVSATAKSGTYLMSFLPNQEIDAVLRYAVAKGYRNVAALYPQSQYGGIVSEAALKSAAVYGASISPAGRYDRTNPGASSDIARIAEALKSGSGEQALLLPEGGDTLKALGSALEAQGVSPDTIKVLGTGLWDDKIAPTVPLVQGGWYAGVPPQLVSAFDSKYQAAYGAKPPRIASLAYDAATLATTLARSGDFSQQAITNPSGFQGQNGLFRFRQNGLIERGLAILEMDAAGPRELSPAPSRFSAGS